MISLCPSDFVRGFRKPLTATLGYVCSWALLFWAKGAPNPKNDVSEDSEESEVDNRLEKIHFADLVKDAKSVAGFPLLATIQVGQNDAT